jgi:DNA-binding transcriptional LysR family regulator
MAASTAPNAPNLDFRGDRLASFVAVAREGGFSRGARALGRTQSSLSQAVALLEHDLGEPLFVRDGRTTHLTDAGRVLLAHAERAFAELAAARAELAALRDLTAGTLSLGASDTFATYLLPPVFAAFRARYPDVDLRLDNRPSPAIAERVGARGLDLGVVSLPLPSAAAAAVRVEVIGPQRDVAIVPPGHPLARARRVGLAHLAEHPLLLLDRSTATRAYLDAGFAARGLAPRVRMEMSSVEVLKRLVELGFGVSVVPQLAAAREVKEKTLVALPLANLPGAAARQVGLVTPTSGPLSRAARAFIEVVRTSL